MLKYLAEPPFTAEGSGCSTVVVAATLTTTTTTVATAALGAKDGGQGSRALRPTSTTTSLGPSRWSGHIRSDTLLVKIVI